MNLDAIKKKLDTLQQSSNNNGSNKTDYPQLKKFKPSVGKQTVRVVHLSTIKIILLLK